MPTLRDKESGQFLGKISEEELQFLLDQLEEESEDDTDYYLDADTIDFLEEEGAPASLLTLLRAALGEKEGLDVEWSR
ncbi:MAG: galactosyldiacylglycerol synthase [Gemmatimonadaceae bacterium]